jgi:serine/threonine protein phosphatase PrpC
MLCGDGLMDFVHRPKSKVLKILKNWNHNVSEAGRVSVLEDGSTVSFRNAVILIFNILIFYSSDDGQST